MRARIRKLYSVEKRHCFHLILKEISGFLTREEPSPKWSVCKDLFIQSDSILVKSHFVVRAVKLKLTLPLLPPEKVT